MIHDFFTTCKNLLILLHPFDSQRMRLNCAFTKHAPKTIMFSKTYTLFDCLSFVIIIDSLGYEGCLKQLLADIFKKLDNIQSNVLLGWAKREDTLKNYILGRQQSKKEKIRQTAEKKLKRMQQRVENSEAKHKGNFYFPVNIPTKCRCGMTARNTNGGNNMDYEMANDVEDDGDKMIL